MPKLFAKVFAIVCDESAETAVELEGVKKLYFPLMIDGKEVKLSRKEVIKLLQEGKVFSTSQVPVSAWLRAFKEAKEPILAITISSKLSGTYNSAVLAAKMCNKEVYVLDSGSISVGEGLILKKAVELREKGLSLKEAAEELESFKKRVELYFVVKNLSYLARSGRINAVIAKLGNFIGINPIMKFALDKISIVKIVRGYEKAAMEMLNVLGSFEEVAVSQVASDSIAEKLAKELKVKDIAYLTPPISAHVGPAIAVGVVK